MNNPFFSIAVVCLNAEETIKATLESILKQSCNDFEIIVKDGVSKDNTLSLIPDNERIHIYSEKDTGIYDAMNQVVKYCSGEYIVYMNCGDSFADKKVLEYVKEHILKQGERPSIIYGDYRRKDTYCKQPSELTDFYLYRTPLNHQSMFFHCSVFNDVGFYDTSMKIYADYELTLKTFKAKKPFSHIDLLICDYMGDGVSESPKLAAIKKEEYLECVNRYFTKKEIRKFEFYLKLSLKGLRQKIARDSSPKWVKKLYRWVVNKVNR